MKLFYRPPEIWNRPLVGGIAQVEDHWSKQTIKSSSYSIQILWTANLFYFHSEVWMQKKLKLRVKSTTWNTTISNLSNCLGGQALPAHLTPKSPTGRAIAGHNGWLVLVIIQLIPQWQLFTKTRFWILRNSILFIWEEATLPLKWQGYYVWKLTSNVRAGKGTTCRKQQNPREESMEWLNFSSLSPEFTFAAHWNWCSENLEDKEFALIFISY